MLPTVPTQLRIFEMRMIFSNLTFSSSSLSNVNNFDCHYFHLNKSCIVLGYISETEKNIVLALKMEFFDRDHRQITCEICIIKRPSFITLSFQLGKRLFRLFSFIYNEL